MENCIKAFNGEKELPNNACLLTFDDGLSDHYISVFPILKHMGLTGAFFPSVRPIMENKISDVHKIHFILANTKKPELLRDKIFKLMKPFRKKYNLPDNKTLYSKFSTQRRFDPPLISFIKNILQRGLPEELREQICSKLFKLFVTDNENAFSRELYMNKSQLKLMIQSGMYIGGHGYAHERFGELTDEDQRKKIKKTYNFLEILYNESPMNWVMSYPHGSKNDKTISILKEYNCGLGLTVIPELAAVRPEIKFDIPRLETNFFPVSVNAKISKWTRIIMDLNDKH